MDPSDIQLSRDFKFTFAQTHGKRVLENIKLFCRGNVTQPLFSEENQHQTSYNLGANAVYRYIQHQIDLELNTEDPEDCQTEPEQKGI